MSQRSQGRKGIKYIIYSPREYAQIGKLGSIYGPTGAAKYYKRKTGFDINESTVCSFKKCMKLNTKVKDNGKKIMLLQNYIPKRDRKLLLGKKLTLRYKNMS